MREVRIEIDREGRVRVLYSGFVGSECFNEAKKLYNQLKALGLEVSIEQVMPTQEYYVSQTQKIKEVLRNGN